MTKTEGVKRKLKPVIEKKRRDRINHNLDALRDLLFKSTADTRLQNPKLEKAEILDLAVQYIKKTTRKTETKVTSNQMDSKATQKQSVSTGPIYASDFYVPDFYGRFKSSEQKEALLKLGVNNNNLTGASKAGNEPVAQTGFPLSPSGQNYQQDLLLHPESSLDGSKLLHQSTSPPSSSSSSSSSQCSSPPSSPTFTSLFSSPSNCPPYLFMPCPLPAPSDSLSPLSTPLSLHRPVIVPQPILPNMARDFTPPQSPVLAIRLEPSSLPTQSIWRPWS
ncbi:transcription factor HES-7-like [Sinocyclocheilus anshuiensis]|uniref:Transcription factor HES-7-like n=1 Tax=Sinocyclocheilus anshuiensis TaxID=1608454 RepID=A0A671LKJ8_9TELE|nr:PREDICTED: transcription factor HES-7-like [Sinocyclocheilus anshuiensis]